MIMEDASPVAITVAGMDPGARKAALTDLGRAIGQLGILIAAVGALSD